MSHNHDQLFIYFFEQMVLDLFRTTENEWRKHTIHFLIRAVKESASFQWSFGPNSAWGSKESTTILTTRPSLYFCKRWVIWTFDLVHDCSISIDLAVLFHPHLLYSLTRPLKLNRPSSLIWYQSKDRPFWCDVQTFDIRVRSEFHQKTKVFKSIVHRTFSFLFYQMQYQDSEIILYEAYKM